MSFYDSQNTDQWGSSFGSSTPAYSFEPASQSPAAPASQDYSYGNSVPDFSSQAASQSPAAPAFQNAPCAVPVIDTAVPVIDTADLHQEDKEERKISYENRVRLIVILGFGGLVVVSNIIRIIYETLTGTGE